MGEILGIGVTHFPGLMLPDAYMSSFLTRTLKSERVPEEIKEMAWKAQLRLHKRYARLAAAGKEQCKITTAVGRELLGFIWAIGVKTEAAASRAMAA